MLWWISITVEPRLSRPRLSGFLDYPDFFSGPNLIINIYLLRPRSVAISFLKLQWKVQSNAKVFCSQGANAMLAHFVTNEEHSNEFWLAQSCIVAKWNFMLYGLLSIVWKRHNNVNATQIMQLWRMMELSMCIEVFISFAGFCSSLIFMFSITRTLDYPKYWFSCGPDESR